MTCDVINGQPLNSSSVRTGNIEQLLMFTISEMLVIAKMGQRSVNEIADRMIDFTRHPKLDLVVVVDVVDVVDVVEVVDAVEVVVVDIAAYPPFFVVVIKEGRHG